MWLGHVGVWFYVVLLIAPLYYLVISSFKSNTDVLAKPFSPFVQIIWSNYAEAWSRAGLGQSLLSSAYITIGAEILSLVLAIPAAFALARAKGRVGAWVERVFSLGFLLPGFACLVPTVMLSISMGLFHTREFMIIYMPATAMPLSVILLTQAMRAIPHDLEESAMLDGASSWKVLVNVFLPLTVPTVTVVGILNFLAFWNEYFFSLVIIGPDQALRTAQVAVPALSSQNASHFGILAAGVIITLIPVYLVYTVFADKMEGAMLAGALKG
jgi:multiple sugar transport system permease protein